MKVKFICEKCGAIEYYCRLTPREARKYKRIRKREHIFICNDCNGGQYSSLGW